MIKVSRVSLAIVVCALLLARPSFADPAPTFSKDVAPILFERCVSCPRAGEVAPFALTSYPDARRRARLIADVTSRHLMPPWKAEPGHGDFVGERRLTDQQIQTLRDWSRAGAPEGNPADLPPLPKFTDGWHLGQPDLVVKMTEPYTLAAEGRDDFRVFVIPLNLDQDKYVRAVEFRPGNRSIVHHALFFLDNSGTARQLDAQEPGPGYRRMGGPGFTPSGGLGGWAPGFTPHFLPDGVGRPVRKGADLVVQVHFHPSGKPEIEQSSVGLYFTKQDPQKVMIPFPWAARRSINIPPGEKNYQVRTSFTIDPVIAPNGVTLVGLTPHAHLLCKEVKVDATLPSGQTTSLIWIKDYDWDWQDEYFYKNPVQLPVGTKVDMYYRYDNSPENPKNPSNPPKRVTWGEQTTDEMAIVFFHVVVDRNTADLARLLLRGRGGATQPPAQQTPRAQQAAPESVFQQMLLRRFDKNANGKLDPEERQAAREALGAESGGAGK